jgi:hypothetical protein
VAQDQPGRRLRTRITKQRKRFKVAGRYSIGAARGTAWWTEDTCDGTLTRVQSGTVRVEDLELRKTVTVKAGDTYLAKPR